MYSKDALIAALQLRYDSYSAGAVLEIARNRAELADKPRYDANELRALRVAIEASGDRVGRVLDALDDLLGSAAVKADEKPAAKLDEKQAAKVDEKPAAKSDEKTLVKPDETSDAKLTPEKSVEPVATDATIETTIVLAGFETDDDDEVLLCGASDLLGDWDPARAQPMARSGDQWLAQLNVPAGAELAFKFIRRTPDGDVSWEPGDDRTLVAKPRIEVNAR